MDVFYVNIYFEDRLDSLDHAGPGHVLSRFGPALGRAVRLNAKFAGALARLDPAAFYYIPLPLVHPDSLPVNAGGLRKLLHWIGIRKPNSAANEKSEGPSRLVQLMAWAPTPSYGLFTRRVGAILKAGGLDFRAEPALPWGHLAHGNSKIILHQKIATGLGDPAWSEIFQNWQRVARQSDQSRVKREYGQHGRYQRSTAPGPGQNLPGLRYLTGPPEAAVWTDGRRRLLAEPEVDVVLEFARQYRIDALTQRIEVLPGFTVTGQTGTHSGTEMGSEAKQTIYVPLPSQPNLDGNHGPSQDGPPNGTHQIIGSLQILHYHGWLPVDIHSSQADELWQLVSQQIVLLAQNEFLQFALAHSQNYNGHCSVDSYVYQHQGQLYLRGVGEFNMRRCLGVVARSHGLPQILDGIEYRVLSDLLQ